MKIKCLGCGKTREHNAKGLCKDCYDKTPEYRKKRSILRSSREQTESQKGRKKPVKRVNVIIRKIKRTGGLRDSEDIIIKDIMVIREEIEKLKKNGI